MESVWQLLYEPDAGLLKLFTPPFEEENRPTFIPGNRENGDQSASAACWAMGAYGRLGQSSHAWELALRLHKALGLSVYSRTDMILDEEGRLWCLETNSLPGMTPASFVPKEAAAVGMSYNQLCEEIVRLSYQIPRKG